MGFLEHTSMRFIIDAYKCDTKSPVACGETVTYVSGPALKLEIMKSSILTIFVATLTIPSILIAAPATLIGLENPPLPEGCKDQGSGILGASHAFAYVELLCGNQVIVVLERFIERRGKVAYFRVIDELRLPSVARGQVVLAAPVCGSSSHPNDAIFAIGRWAEARDGSFVAKDISHAWRFNLTSGKIETISTRGVSCDVDTPH